MGDQVGQHPEPAVGRVSRTPSVVGRLKESAARVEQSPLLKLLLVGVVAALLALIVFGLFGGGGASRTKWEYLVVSTRPVSFQLVGEDLPSNKFGSERTPWYYSDLGSDRLDRLGALGWELVGTVGVISGDQMLYFRRPR